MAGAKQHFTLNAKVEKHEDVFVGYCVELGTVTQGNSLEETCENLKDAIYVHLSVTRRSWRARTRISWRRE